MEDQDFEAFAYTVSHDLREPVRMVRSFMELLHKKYGDQLDEKAMSYIHFALDGSRRLDQMIQDLLVFYRAVKPGEKSRFDLASLLQEQVSDMLRQEPSIKFECLPGDPVTILADENAWRQCLQFLLADLTVFLPSHDKKQVRAELRTDGGLVNLNILAPNAQADAYAIEQSFRLFNKAGAGTAEGAYRIGWPVVKRMVAHWGGRFECRVNEDNCLELIIQVPV